MAERQSLDQQHAVDSHSPSASKEDMITYVMALEAALLPCLPARELQAIDRSPHPSHQTDSRKGFGARRGCEFDERKSKREKIDVERHARDFMEAAKKLQLHFISLQREDQPTKAEMLRKEIAMMEDELKLKTELIGQQDRLIQGWKKDLQDQLDKHNAELERV